MTSSVHERFVIGVDDTDSAKGGGTGPLVRALAARVEDEGFGTSLGVTRHRLLDSTKIAKTSRNSALALVVETERGLDEVEDYAVAFVRAEAERDADPGVAVLSRHSDMPHILAFGRRSQQEVMKLLDSARFASEGNVRLRPLGNNQNGTIGALAAAGLRAGGGDGYYIALRGLEDVRGRTTAGKIRVETAIEKVLDEATGEELDRDDAVDAGEGLWPRLDAGEPLLLTTRSEDDRKLWLPIDRNPPSGAV
jgi:tRNA(Ile2) C34 agmatinyltransferase TiaS